MVEVTFKVTGNRESAKSWVVKSNIEGDEQLFPIALLNLISYLPSFCQASAKSWLSLIEKHSDDDNPPLVVMDPKTGNLLLALRKMALGIKELLDEIDEDQIKFIKENRHLFGDSEEVERILNVPRGDFGINS